MILYSLVMLDSENPCHDSEALAGDPLPCTLATSEGPCLLLCPPSITLNSQCLHSLIAALTKTAKI